MGEPMNSREPGLSGRVRSCVFAAIVPVFLCAGAPRAETPDVADVYERISSAVVVIETTQRDVSHLGTGQLVSIGGLGSGVLISEDGKVMTAAHVVQAADQVVVRFLSGEKIPGRVLSSEPAADLALIQLERRPSDVEFAMLGDSDRVRVGERIFVVGAPFGIDHTLTVGHISARRLEDTMFGSMMPTEILQTDAAINQGNSGGPMFNMDGEVVGIVSYIISQGGSFEGLGFVITSNMARRLLLEERTLWSGIEGTILSGELARVLNIPGHYGMLVERVAENSPASHLGVQGGQFRAQIEGIELVVGGDVILEVMGHRLSDPWAPEKARQAMSDLKAGDEITLAVLRGGQVLQLKNFYSPDLLLPQAPGE